MSDLRTLRDLLRRGYLWYGQHGLSSAVERMTGLIGSRRAPSRRSYTRWLAAEPGAPRGEGAHVLLSILVPVHDPPAALLEELVASVRAQEHAAWELLLADDACADAAVLALLDELPRRDPRVRRVTLPTGARGISLATNAAAAAARGEVLLLVDHDDRLAHGVLARLAAAFAADPALDLAWTDEDQLTARGERVHPTFRPGPSPVLLLGFNCVTHLLAVRRTLWEQLGGLRPEFDGSQDHDLALRAFEHARRVAHVPGIGYHWRRVRGSVADTATAKPWAFEAGRRAVEAACARRGLPVASVLHGTTPGVYTLVPQPLPRPLRARIILRGPDRGCAAWTLALGQPAFTRLLEPAGPHAITRNAWPEPDAAQHEPDACWLVIDATLEPQAEPLAALLPWLALPGIGGVAAAGCLRGRRRDLGWSVSAGGRAQPVLPRLRVRAAGPGLIATSVREVASALGGLLCVCAPEAGVRAALAGRPASAADELCLALSPWARGQATLFVPGSRPRHAAVPRAPLAAAPAAVDLTASAAWPGVRAALPADFWQDGADRFCPRHELLTDLGMPAPVDAPVDAPADAASAAPRAADQSSRSSTA